MLVLFLKPKNNLLISEKTVGSSEEEEAAEEVEVAEVEVAEEAVAEVLSPEEAPPKLKVDFTMDALEQVCTIEETSQISDTEEVLGVTVTHIRLGMPMVPMQA